MTGHCFDRLTLVVLTYNRSKELCRSLSRLCALPEQPTIIVVDNGSTDDTAERVPREFPQVQLVQTGANLGAAGRNLGVEKVRTPYVAFSDDDTWWAPGALAQACDLLDKHPAVTILVARIFVGVDERADPASMAMARSPLEQVPGIGPQVVGFMAGASVMRCSAFRQAGGYWKPFFIGGEESLLAMDVLDAGGQIVYAPMLRVHHWPSSLRDSALRRMLLARNAIWTAWMRLPWRVAWQRSLVSLGTLPSSALRWRTVLDTLAGAREVLSHRRVLSRETCALLQQVWQHEAGKEIATGTH